jgi:hypothetical protein
MGRNVAIFGFLVAAVHLLPTSFAAAETSFKEMFTDPADGAFDMSRFIKTRTGFVPILAHVTAREFGLQMGVDAARGPEQWAIYVVFGNSWN